MKIAQIVYLQSNLKNQVYFNLTLLLIIKLIVYIFIILF